jgi:hypothetical protein
MPFPLSYDRTAKIISILVSLALLAAVAAIHNIIVTPIVLFLLFLAYAYSPRGYNLTDRSIRVMRLAGEVRFALEDVREARRTSPDDFRGCIRLRGSGGLFGYYGLFRTAKLGRCTWYVTNRSNCVVVITGAKTALFSPDNPDGFLDTIRTLAPISHSPTPVPAQKARSFVKIGKLIAVAAGLTGMSFAILAMVYSPGPPSFTLTRETLTIHDRFYPVTLEASDVDIDRVRIVDLTHDTDWKPVVRTNGFANSHYRSGWFQLANGQKVRLYRADSDRVVLLPPRGDGAPVLVQATDPEKFMGEIRTAWTEK